MPRVPISTSIAAIALVCSAANLQAQAVVFNTQDFASYPGARGIAAADFDRNGWADIAHANAGRNTVTILLNQAPASQSFTRAYDIAVGTGPFDLAAADFNRDGIPDLAVANADAASVSILLGRTTGGFSRADIGVAPGPRALATADFNKDGKVDLAVTSWDANSVQVYYGDGTGGFVSGGPGVGGAGAHPQGLAIADFNHDGSLDIVVAHESSAGLVLFAGTASGGLSARPIGGEPNLNVVAVGDFNRDGWMDVAAASTSGNRVAIYLAASSTLRLARTYAVGGSPRGIVAEDVNHDGMLDLVTANRTTGTISLLLGNASSPGSFDAARDFSAGSGSRAIVSADFDHDGRIDLATANQNASTASVLWNETAFDRAGFSFKRLSLGTPSTSMGGANQGWPADFNEDGKLDILTEADYRLGRRLHVLINGGSTVPLVYDHGLSGFAVADFNNDFHADVIIWQASDPFLTTVYLGDGHGGFNKGPTTSGSQRLWAMGLGDVNQDGKIDLVFGGYDPGISSYIVQLMLGTGDGGFRAGARVTTANYVWQPRIADVNRDGKPDVAATVFTSGLTTWFGDGTGALRAGWSPTPGHDGGYLALGDLNHDAFVDAVTTDSQNVRISLGTPTGFTSPMSIPTTHSNWSDVAIADVTMDGHPDIAGAPGFVIPGHGDGTFGEIDWFAFEGVGLHIADFTRDGLPDLITAVTDGAVEVIVNERNSINHAPAVDAGPDQTFEWTEQLLDESPSLLATGADPDLHRLTYEWRDEAGNVLTSYNGWLGISGFSHGTHTLTVTVTDGRGGTASDPVDVTIVPTKEIVVWAANGIYAGNWTEIDDTAAAGGSRGHDANLGSPKVTAPSANPSSFMELQFIADPTQTYKLWVRLKADNNSWANDSVWLQFSGSTDASGNAAYRQGTTSGLPVNLEECSGCGVSGWGWEDDGWGAIDRQGVLLRFPEGGYQRLVIQTREDGVSIDQVVLSSEKYVKTRPGAAKNDNTILRFTFWRDES